MSRDMITMKLNNFTEEDNLKTYWVINLIWIKPKDKRMWDNKICQKKKKYFTVWLDLRNKASHGKYSECKENQVKQLIIGVSIKY